MLGGVYEDCIFTADGMERLKDFPTMEEAHAQLLGTINAPVTNLVGVQLLGLLNHGPKQLVGCLEHGNKSLVNLLSARKEDIS